MLFIISTPIGNLADLTFRAVETLKKCDKILCEDTRHSSVLLSHYDIHKPLQSYHSFNESSTMDSIIQDLRANQTICLITDAGTPGISDPGSRLIETCIQEQLPYTLLPGPCALIQALVGSGLSTDRFQFIGFFPRQDSERRRTLLEILDYPGTTLFYESPQRLLDVLALCQQVAPEREIVVARELTKKFEEWIRGTAAEHITHWSNKNETIKGECVVLLAGKPTTPKIDWSDIDPQDHVHLIEKTYGITKKEAIKVVAELRGVSKREIYQTTIQDP